MVSTTDGDNLVAAIVDERGEDLTEIESFAAARGWTIARRFGPNDLDDLDRAIRRSKISRVVARDPTLLTEAVWNNEVDPTDWSDWGVELHFVEELPDSLPAFVARRWKQWDNRRRRRRTIAGLVLSGIALAAAFILGQC
jgi:hypothetical protein